MWFKTALLLSVFLQFITAIIAMTLVKRTKTNIAWWLISGGFVLMAIRRVLEVEQEFDLDNSLTENLLRGWIGVAISVIMLLSLIFIKRIFNVQNQIETIRKQNESRVLSAIIKTEEKERQHFAKELHDGLGPLLSSVKMAISASLYMETDNRAILTNAEKLVDESIITIKDISNKLSPDVLINFGLSKAIKSFINKLNIIGNPLISINSNIEDNRFPYNIEVVLYRVISELISNTLQHANAHNIYIDLLTDKKTISLLYIDDGVGFNVVNVENGISGFGYFNIKSRIKSLNGSCNITSKEGEGMRVNIEIAL